MSKGKMGKYGTGLTKINPNISASSSSPTMLLLPIVNIETEVTGILICNTTSTDRDASIFIRNQPANGGVHTDAFLAKDVKIPANTTIELIQGSYPVYRKKGASHYYQLMGYASAADSIDIIIAYSSAGGM